MIIGRKSSCNIHTIKVIVLLFELISRLKVNFHKSLLVCLNVDSYWFNEAALMLNCKTVMTSFNYLGIPVDDNTHKLSFLNHVVDHRRIILLEVF